MSENSSDRNTAIDYLNRDIVNIKSDLNNLNKIVRDGNGQPSLIQQVITITNDLKHYTDEFRTDIKRNNAEFKTELAQLRQSNILALESVEKSVSAVKTTRDTNWQFRAAVLVALISSVTSIILQLIG